MGVNEGNGPVKYTMHNIACQPPGKCPSVIVITRIKIDFFSSPAEKQFFAGISSLFSQPPLDINGFMTVMYI